MPKNKKPSGEKSSVSGQRAAAASALAKKKNGSVISVANEKARSAPLRTGIVIPAGAVATTGPLLSNFGISSPAENAQIVSELPGISVTIQGTFTVSGFNRKQGSAGGPSAGGQIVGSLDVNVQLGSQDTQHQANLTFTNVDNSGNGSGTWLYTGLTPAGGKLTVNVTGVINYQTSVWDAETHKLTWTDGSTSPQLLTVDLVTYDYPIPTISFPTYGQVLIGGPNGAQITATGSATLSSAVSSVNWSLDTGSSGIANKDPNAGWQSWNAAILVPLGVHTLSFTVTDTQSPPNTSPAIPIRVQVALPTDIFDVEPVSYLKALIDFGTQYFNSDGTARITTDSAQKVSLALGAIDGTFYQSIADLLDPQNFAKTIETVHQTRICVEVLRKYLAANPPAGDQAQGLKAAQSAYCQAAYLSLLTQIGSSYDEIRMARTYDRSNPDDQKKLQAICDRLSIELGSRTPASNNQDHLDQLFVDASQTSTSLTEQFLEQTLGLVDTGRDPFSQGATIGDVQNQITRWNLKDADWNFATDPDGMIYVTIAKPTVTLYSDAARTNELASGTMGGLAANGNVTVSLSAVKPSTVTGSITLAYKSDTNQAALSVFPRFLTWQFQRLRTTWLAQDFPSDDVLTFQLTATDSLGTKAAAVVDVNVAHINRLLVTAGPNCTVNPGAAVTLTGNAPPSAPGATISSYQWTQVAGPAVLLSGAQTSKASFVAPAVTSDTVLSFQLNATDSTGATGIANVNVTVFHVDHPLTVSAGPNQSVIQGATVSLAATTADLNSAASISYEWTQTAGPTVTLNNPNAASASFTAPAVTADTGLTFQVTVTDSVAATAAATVDVTVRNIDHPLIISSAGPNGTVNGGQKVTLTGSATDYNPEAKITFQWTQTAGPTVVLNNANTDAASFLAPAVSSDTVLTFQLTVSDSSGATATATVNQTVSQQGRPGLVISAGATQMVSAGTNVTLSGTAQLVHGNGGAAAYQWTQIAGPAAALSNANSATAAFVAPTVVVDTPLTFQLTVSATLGGQPASATATVTVTVYKPDSIPLTVNAGASEMVTEGTAVALNGSAVDANPGATLSYQWAQVGGPPVTLSNSNSATATFTAPLVTTDAVLTFEITATDSTGATSAATANVSVYHIDHPIAVNAGASQVVTERATATLSGSATDSTPGANIIAYQWIQVAGRLVILNNANTATPSFVAPGNAPGPIIDPDLLINGDFKHVQVSPYTDLYVARQTQLQSWLTQLQNARQTADINGFNAMLKLVLKGKQLRDLQNLSLQLQAGNDITAQLEAMALSLTAFNYLLQLGALLIGTQPLLDSEWNELYSILVQVQKLQNFPTWRSKETGHASLGPHYFNFPPETPALFATGVDSNGDALPDNASANTADLHWNIISTPTAPTGPSSPAFVTVNGLPIGQAWMRNTATSRWISPKADESQTQGQPGDPLGQYTYRANIDLTGYDPASVRLTANVAVDSNLMTIKLNGRDLGLQAAGPTGFAILEVDGPFQPGLNTLDFIVNNVGTTAKPSGLRVELSFSSSPLLATLIPWRGTLQARQTWEDTLSGRIGQSDSLLRALNDIQNVTEETQLPLLRDALVQACAMNSIPVTSDWLTQCLLIDSQEDSIQKTSRLNLATDTMQQMFFALRRRQFDILQPQPPLMSWSINEDLHVFDQEWTWMKSYSNWRSLTSVFLYPENMLMPTLRLGATKAVPNEPTTEPTAIGEQTQAFSDFASTLGSYGVLTLDRISDANSKYINDLNATDTSKNPAVALYPHLPPELNGYEYLDPRTLNLEDLQATSKKSLSNYSSTGDSTKIAYLWEAWYFVPVQIALELHKAGQFEAALDWFRTVYAYDLPLTAGGQSDNQRKTFYGLAMENSGSQYLQVPTWMVDSSNPHQIAPTRAYPYTRFTILSIIECLLDFADAQFASETDESISNALSLYLNALNLLFQMQEVLTNDPVTDSNPRLASMRQHAKASLFKLHTGRNIAGNLRPMQRTFIQPSAYRYSALIDRAKQIVSLAQQVENSYLAALQKADDESYTALRASQDLETANATVKLQSLKGQEASDGETLAKDQQARATDQQKHYQGLLDQGESQLEQQALAAQQTAAQAGAIGSIFNYLGGLLSGNPLQAVGALFQGVSGAESQQAQYLSTQASYERRAQEWQFQLSQASDDLNTAKQQVIIAGDQKKTADQELEIATTQADHAQTSVTFLATKFTNADLYRWMSGVLGRVYAFFLHEATATARLAESQLAFERQEESLSIIQPDYWQPLSSGTGNSGSGQTPSNAGLTGADRLLQDITELDDYAFKTEQLKLQLTKTISLAQMDPFAFQLFRATGVLRFSTPMDIFDRDFPGQYLRVIKRVHVSVIALIPPTQGIRATLANHGISRVVVKNDSGDFQTTLLQRVPQLIALSAAANATGMFDLTDSQPGLLLPFEDLGVDTSWEFVMPKAANPFDYSSIADVLISIDYSALNDLGYEKQVIQQLDQSVSADRAYSFRQQFADAWYDLNNPTQSGSSMVIQFQTQPQDFPPNVQTLSIGQLVLYFVPAAGATFAVQPKATLTLAGTDTKGNPATAGGTATAINSVISTRRGNAGSWKQIIGIQPAGTWKLDLSDPGTSSLFSQNQIQDILFVITYNGQLPAWPS